MNHEFKPHGGMKENPGVWDNNHGGLIYVSRCVCGVLRRVGKDTTGSRPTNNFGPYYYNAKLERLPHAGACTRVKRPRFITAENYDQWSRMCRGKQRHKFQSFAESHRRAVQDREGVPYDVYHCPFCEGWHVGHQLKLSVSASK